MKAQFGSLARTKYLMRHLLLGMSCEETIKMQGSVRKKKFSRC